MQTVQELADRYLCHVDLITGLLAKLGHPGTTARTRLSLPLLIEFDALWGDKIRAARLAARPATEARSEESADQELAPPPMTFRDRFRPTSPIMRVAHAEVGAGRDRQGNREKRLLANPGLVHAIDLNGTWDGDRWRGAVVPGAVHFFGGPINSGPRAACGRMHMRAVLGDEFVPADEPEREGQCPRCALVVREDRGFRSRPGSYDPFCHAYLSVKIDGQVEVQNCFLSGSHRGPHRTRDGATWDIGYDDFVPAPLDMNRRIAKVS
jgi:hypothetical protein